MGSLKRLWAIGFGALVLTAVLPGAMANDVTVVPCWMQPVNGVCPAKQFPNNGTPSIGNNDYYDVSIQSVCIDQPDSWWHQKLLNFTAVVKIGSTAMNIPVFADHQAGAGCRLAVNGFSLMNSVPSNGSYLQLSASILRSDANDGLKQILSFVSGEQQQSALTTYMTSSLPFVSLASAIAGQAYAAFGNHQEAYLNSTPTSLHPSGALPDMYDLEDGYLLQYHGPDDPSGPDLYVDSGGDVRWAADNSYLRNGATWVLFKIQKYSTRTDYVTRTWYTDWQDAVTSAAAGQLNPNDFETRYMKDIVLLQNDADFTEGDKQAYIDAFNKTKDAIISELNQPAPNLTAMRASIAASMEQAMVIHSGPAHPVTATNTSNPTVVRLEQSTAPTVISPSKLASELEIRLAPRK